MFAKYWVSRDGLKKGYSPATYTFKGSDYIPVSNEIIQQHLEGKIRLGTYVVVNQTMAKFLVIDLDKASFTEDARAIKQISSSLGLKPLFGFNIKNFRLKTQENLGTIRLKEGLFTMSCKKALKPVQNVHLNLLKRMVKKVVFKDTNVSTAIITFHHQEDHLDYKK